MEEDVKVMLVVTSNERKWRCDCSSFVMVLPRSLRSLADPHIRMLNGESVVPTPVTFELNIIGVGEGARELLPLSRRSVILWLFRRLDL